ncbi:TRAP transporter substrate-binding protein DctP [Marinobacter sediminum]|uniref:TRAP transporter substrate-binding protein DctP n=1 Tax=Marinobacter sediminum TaxID=256323 RepID=UPI00203098F1|nr:TRAP transporter substrate-binding protein DctP [Marinobacter sediminum]MCM0612793.1 TRAP transporter substrate-binding protein DctP [Marinobacter sediminum]
MRITSLWLPFLATLLFTLAGCSESGPSEESSATPETSPPDYPVTWRFALEEIEGSVQHAYAEALKERIEEHSDGKVELDIFPYGSLGTSEQLTELARNGSVNLAFASPGHLADEVPEAGVFTLHYLLSDNEEVNRQLLASPELRALFDEAYASQQLKLLAFVPEGWMAWTANKPLRSPEDFKGLRIRTMTSNIATLSYRAYGAEPSQVPYSQVYTDLQLNNIDAQSNPIFAIEEMDFYDVQSTLTLARPTQFISSVVSNQDWYNDLPGKQKQWLTEALEGVGEIAWKTQAELNQVRLQSMLEGGQLQVVRLSEEERAAFREKSQAVRQTYVDQTDPLGGQILDRIMAMVDELEAQQADSAPGDGG